MNIPQLNNIHFFYDQFYLHIRAIEQENAGKSESEIKTVIKCWLLETKKRKTFSEDCRHEIMHMIDDLNHHPLQIFKSNIRNFSRNIQLIKLELETQQSMHREWFNRNIAVAV